jgi:hypothetical protein
MFSPRLVTTRIKISVGVLLLAAAAVSVLASESDAQSDTGWRTVGDEYAAPADYGDDIPVSSRSQGFRATATTRSTSAKTQPAWRMPNQKPAAAATPSHQTSSNPLRRKQVESPEPRDFPAPADAMDVATANAANHARPSWISQAAATVSGQKPAKGATRRRVTRRPGTPRVAQMPEPVEPVHGAPNAPTSRVLQGDNSVMRDSQEFNADPEDLPLPGHHAEMAHDPFGPSPYDDGQYYEEGAGEYYAPSCGPDGCGDGCQCGGRCGNQIGCGDQCGCGDECSCSVDGGCGDACGCGDECACGAAIYERGCACGDPSCGCPCGGDRSHCCCDRSCNDCLCIGPGDDEACHQVRIRLPRPQSWTIHAGVHGFKGPLDQDRDSGNFGFHEGTNIGAKIPYTFAGYQVGYQAVQSQLNGDKDLDIDKSHTQHFTTFGLFRRTKDGLQFGTAWDVLFDDRWGHHDFHQLRNELSWVDCGGHEFGASATVGMNRDPVDDDFDDDDDDDDDDENLWQAADQYVLFYRLHGKRGGEGRFYAGVTEDSDAILGSDMLLPVHDRWSVETGFTYLAPDEEDGEDGATEEAWHLHLGVVWHWGATARTSHDNPYRPLFNLANNGYLIVDKRVEED